MKKSEVKDLIKLYKSYLKSVDFKSDLNDYKSCIKVDFAIKTLAFLQDLAANNKFSIVQVYRIKGILESCAILPLCLDQDFQKYNIPLFSSSMVLLQYKFFHQTKVGRVSKNALVNVALNNFKTMEQRDYFHTQGVSSKEITDSYNPILLGRNIKEIIRNYLGFVQIGIYERADEFSKPSDCKWSDKLQYEVDIDHVIELIKEVSNSFSVTIAKTRNLKEENKLNVNSILKCEEHLLLKLDELRKNEKEESYLFKQISVLKDILISMCNSLSINLVGDIYLSYLALFNELANLLDNTSFSLSSLNYHFEEEAKLYYGKKSQIVIDFYKSKGREINLTYVNKPVKFYANLFKLSNKSNLLHNAWSKGLLVSYGNCFLPYYYLSEFTRLNQEELSSVLAIVKKVVELALLKAY